MWTNVIILKNLQSLYSTKGYYCFKDCCSLAFFVFLTSLVLTGAPVLEETDYV